MQRSFWTRSLTFVLWLLAGASVVYWSLKFVQGPKVPAMATAALSGSVSTTVDAQALAKALGAGQGSTPSAGAPADALPANSINTSRFVLTGVVVSRAGVSRTSVALIGVDGKPARPYRVGASVADGVVLHSVAAGKAMLSTSAQGESSASLELPKLTSAVVGTAVAARPAIPPIPPTPPAAAPRAEPNAAALPALKPARQEVNRPSQPRAGEEVRVWLEPDEKN